MLKNKDVKVTYHTIMQRMWRKRGKKAEDAEDEVIKENPFYMINDILIFVSKLSIKNRFYDLKDDKFCYLDLLQVSTPCDDIVILKGIFESARNEFRPFLINKKTGDKRPNPKAINEGDIDRTHFLVKIDNQQNEVYVFFEKNFYGITIHNFVNYINEFTKSYYIKKKMPKEFSIFHLDIPRANFMTELELLQRTSLAEVYFTKQLLGSKYMNFSNRTISLKDSLILTAKANKKESITEFAVDLYNNLQGKNSPISRIRIRGVDPNNNEVLLDTQAMCKSDYIEVDLNQDTGEINSTQLFTGITDIANSFS